MNVNGQLERNERPGLKLHVISANETLGRLEIENCEEGYSGSMARLFVAFDRSSERECLLKVGNEPVVDEEEKSFLELEAEAMELVGGLGVPTVYACGNVGFSSDQAELLPIGVKKFLKGNHPAIAMELVKGRSLLAISMERGDDALVTLAPRVLVSVARTIDSAAQKGIRHRDISLDNIVIEEGTQRVVLVDWGISTHVVSNRCLEISYDGTYLPPEIGHLDQESIASDIFELACLFYTMISGEHPYGSEEIVDRFGMKHPFPIPRLWRSGGLTETPYEGLTTKQNLGIQVNKETLTKLDLILKRALSIDPQDRHQSAIEFARDVIVLISESDDSWKKYLSELDW